MGDLRQIEKRQVQDTRKLSMKVAKMLSKEASVNR